LHRCKPFFFARLGHKRAMTLAHLARHFPPGSQVIHIRSEVAGRKMCMPPHHLHAFPSAQLLQDWKRRATRPTSTRQDVLRLWGRTGHGRSDRCGWLWSALHVRTCANSWWPTLRPSRHQFILAARQSGTWPTCCNSLASADNISMASTVVDVARAAMRVNITKEAALVGHTVDKRSAALAA